MSSKCCVKFGIIRRMIIDSHVHLITSGMIASAKKSFDRLWPGLMDRALTGGKAIISRETVDFLRGKGVRDLADIWLKELDDNNIARACFLPIRGESLAELDEFISLGEGRFTGYVMLGDPVKKASARALRKWLETGRFRGLKLYPCMDMVSAADKRLFPLYEVAAEFKAPVLVHFGVTHAPASDYRYTNPLDLKLPSKLFPDTDFIIAHFGAGFFREALMLGFHSENIHLDTSGTNNWRLYLPQVMTLDEVFKRALEVYGPDKILFGTDSALNGKAGYRTFVLKEQTETLARLGVSDEDRLKIMGGNTTRLFGL